MKQHLYVILHTIPSKILIRVIKIIREHTLCGLVEAKHMTDCVPYVFTLKEGHPFTWEEARNFYHALQEVGEFSLTKGTCCGVEFVCGDDLSDLVNEEAPQLDRYRAHGKWTNSTDRGIHYAARLDCFSTNENDAIIQFLKWFELDHSHRSYVHAFVVKDPTDWDVDDSAYRSGNSPQKVDKI